MDTAMKAVRVALLILVTGTFACLWSGDHAERFAVVNRPASLLIGRSGTPRRTGAGDLRTSFNPPTLLSTQTLQSSTSRSTKVPLPRGIAAGTYLVADQFGQTEVRTVTLQEIFPDNKFQNQVTENTYTVEIGTARWHFIRLERPVHDRLVGIHSVLGGE